MYRNTQLSNIFSNICHTYFCVTETLLQCLMIIFAQSKTIRCTKSNLELTAYFMPLAAGQLQNIY